ncbi:MAG: fibronectin type III domain-containing protein [Verrucomicrobiia bacterium]
MHIIQQSKPSRLTGFRTLLATGLVLAAFSCTVQAASVTLAWNASTDPTVSGYNLYYGGTSGSYTNKVSVGLATRNVTPGLLVGVTYYFAATTYNAAGMESLYSGEVSYTVPPQPQAVGIMAMPPGQFAMTLTGTVGHTYDIEATQDFKTWTVIGTVTVGPSGSLNFTDTNAASFSNRFYRTRG